MADTNLPSMWRSDFTCTSLRLCQPHIFNITSLEKVMVKEVSTCGNKGVPLKLQFGQDFTHLKTLRDICNLSESEYNSKSSVSNVYNYLYGPKDDLKGTVDKVDSIEIENTLQLGCQPFLHKTIERSRSCTENVSRLEPHCPIPVSQQCYDLMEQTRAICEIKVNTIRLGSTVQQKHKSKSENGCLNQHSDVINACAKTSRQTTGIPTKTSLDDDLICSYTDQESEVKIKESLNSAIQERHIIRHRIRISLQYFRNTRQLKIMLHTVEGLKDCSFDILVQLALIGRTNKQKAMTRKHRVNNTKAHLNEIVYMEPQDGIVSGMFLRIRLCKVTKFFCRKQPFAEGVIPLKDIELSINTTIWLTLKTKLSPKYVRFYL